MIESDRHPPIYIDYLNRFDIAEILLADDELIATIENSLAAQGRGETVIEPRVHLELLRLEEERTQFLHPKSGSPADSPQSCAGRPFPLHTENA